MIYVLAVFFPWLALLLNKQFVSAVVVLVLDFAAILILAPLHLVLVVATIIVIAQRRSKQRHRELVEATRGTR